MTAHRLHADVWFQRVPWIGQHRRQGRLVLAATALAGIVFVFGLALSAAGGFASLYLGSPAMYLGAVGIFHVTVSMDWGARRLPVLTDRLIDCFSDRSSAHAVAQAELTNMGRSKWLLLGVPAFALTTMSAFLLADSSASTTSGLRAALGAGWFDGQATALKAGVLLLYGVPVGTLLLMGVQSLLFSYRMIWRLSRPRHPLRLSFAYVVPRMRRLLTFFTFVALSWSVAVFLVLAMFYRRLDLVSGLFVAVGACLGILTVLVPDLLLHESLVRLENDLTEDMQVEAEAAWRLATEAKDRLAILSGGLKETVANTWILDMKDLFALATSQALPVIYVVVTSGISR